MAAKILIFISQNSHVAKFWKITFPEYIFIDEIKFLKKYTKILIYAN